ncbi:MAG: cache domain-containing protein, partial [Patescibacteria group bacterium]
MNQAPVKIQRKRVLRKRLVLLFFGVATVPFLLATTQVLIKFQNSQRESIILQESRVANEAAKEISSFIRLQFAAIEAVGKFKQNLPEDEQYLHRLIEQTLFSQSDLFELSVLNAEGKELVRAHRIKVIFPADLRDRSDSEEFLAVRKDRRYIGPVFWENNEPFFIIGEAFFSSQDEFLGAVIAQLDARILQKVVRDLSVTKELGQASIFDGDGTIIAHQDFSKVALKENFSRVGIVAEALTSENRRAVAGIFQNEKGEEVIGASEPIQILFGDLGSAALSLNTRWFVVAEIPSYVALASVRDSTIFSVLILLGMLGMAVIVALVLARKIVNPIEQLGISVQKFRDGQLEYKIPIKTRDEIENLAASFYATADELRESMKMITESKRVVEAGKHQLERIISGITDAVIVTDIKGKIIVFNSIAETLTGYAMRDVIAKHIDEVVSIWDQNVRLDVMEK